MSAEDPGTTDQPAPSATAWLAALDDGDVVDCVMTDGTTHRGYVVPGHAGPSVVRVMACYAYWMYSRTTGILKADAHLRNPRRIVQVAALDAVEAG